MKHLPARTTAPWAPTVLLALGLGIYLGSVLLVHDRAFNPLDPVVVHPHAVQAGKILACCIVAVFSTRDRLSAGPLAALACCCALAPLAATYLEPLGIPAAGSSVAGGVAGCVEGISGALMTLVFLALLAARGRRHALAAIPAAIAVSHVILLVCGILPNAIAIWAKPILLILAVTVLGVAWKRLSHTPHHDADAPHSETGPETHIHPAGRVSPLVIAGCVVLPFIYVLVSHVVLAAAPAVDPYSPGLEVALIVGMLVVAGIALLVKGRLGIEGAIIASDAVFATAMLALSLLPQRGAYATAALMQGGFFLFNALLWMYVAQEAHGSMRRALGGLSLANGTLYLFALAGRLTGNLISGMDIADADPVPMLAAVVIWLLAMLLAAMFLLERRRSNATAIALDAAQAELACATAPNADLFAIGCAAVAAQGALSEREQEVMVAFARGRSAGHIARELSISQETVKTHLKHIYAKTGVHSRQELLDRIETAG